uniref:Carboxymuconolactone decarboxylase family protein n=1 Tax=Heterorhabditis bacteriophora TaxID=37862 RepID=A0A1I7XMS9_HETBA
MAAIMNPTYAIEFPERECLDPLLLDVMKNNTPNTMAKRLEALTKGSQVTATYMLIASFHM